MLKSGGIIVSYFGVNQAYQLALAAQELGRLDAFYCSLYDAPGKWGGLMGKLVGHEAMINRHCRGFNAKAAIEIPLPLMLERFKSRFGMKNGNHWFNTAIRFDQRVAARLCRANARLLIGVENCAAESFRVGRTRGMKLVYDCPGFNPEVSGQAALRAAAEWRLPCPAPSDSLLIKANKDQELALADCVLVYSEVHQRSWEQRGIPKEKFIRIPLWIEPGLWRPKPEERRGSEPLRVLFAGRGTLMKGLPYLLEAVRKCGRQVQLNCVGKIQTELLPLVVALPNVNVSPPVPKVQLRDVYGSHDVLVLPSLGDSFGLVALEAMACGLPVVVTENCGVPVPDPAWRVPIMDSAAITQRLEHYAGDRDALAQDGKTAQQFARQFTPERYREQIRNLLQKLLGL